MIRETMNALLACAVSFVLCAVAYPAAVWGVGQLVFPHEAEGSLVYDRGGNVIGSELIAQPFASENYFFSRPSAVDYKADATGGSNLGTKNPDLRKKVIERAEALKATAGNPAPVDLVTASGGGMDPHISPEAAYYQAVRVAEARKIPVGTVKALIAHSIDRSGYVIGAPPRVNVFKLNRDLDAEKSAPIPAPAPTPTAAAEPEKAAAASAPATVGDHDALRSQLDAIAERLEKLSARLDTMGRDDSAASLKALDDRLVKLSDNTRDIPRLAERLDGLDGRLNTADASVRQLQSTLRATRDALKALAPPARAR
jgi:potassium-transporting ATPase KdpC subunit